jgi:hypothetical protein
MNYYEFNSKNALGYKEQYISGVQQPYNFYEAIEVNQLKDKTNELVDFANRNLTIFYPEFRLKFKAEGNLADTLQVGDICHGFYDPTTVWTDCIYLGGDPTDKANYTRINSPASIVPKFFSEEITVAGTQDFTLPSGSVCLAVYFNDIPQYKEDLINTAMLTLWSQTGDVVTIKKPTAINNYIYITYI